MIQTIFKSKVLFAILSILLAVVMGLRNIDFVGDTHNYLTIYTYGNRFMLENVEPTYACICMLAQCFNLGFRTVLIVMSIISIGAMAFAIRKSTKNVLLALAFFILLTYYLYNFNAMRQMAAVSIICLSFTFLKERKNKQFVILVLLASTLHFSSLIALFALYFSKYRKVPYLVVVLITVLSFFIGGSNLTLHLSDFFAILAPKYSMPSDTISENSFSLTRLLMNVFILYVFYHGRVKENLYSSLAVIGIILFNLFSYSGAAMRIAYPFLIVQVLLYSSRIFRNNKPFSVMCPLYAIVIYYYTTARISSVLLQYNFSLEC